MPSPKEKRSVKQEAGASSDDGLCNSSAIDGEVQSAAKLLERVQQALGDGDGPPWMVMVLVPHVMVRMSHLVHPLP